MIAFHRNERALGQTESALGIRILEQSGDQVQSMKILAANGMRALTHREALAHSKDLIEKLGGNWFYIAEEGIQRNVIFTLDGKAHFYGIAFGHRNRFGFSGYCPPDNVAPVVVGVEIRREAALESTARRSPSR